MLFFGFINDNILTILLSGHYAQTLKSKNETEAMLMRAVDDTKDQSYFLCNVDASALARVTFPLGRIEKNVVRKKNV
jgi:tRNA-specific 2-thiouridylase